MEVMRDDFPLAKVDEPYHTHSMARTKLGVLDERIHKHCVALLEPGSQVSSFGCLGAIQVIWMLVRRMLATFLGNAAKSWEQKLASISCEHSASQTLVQILDRPGGSR
jgi:hypothetical protein